MKQGFTGKLLFSRLDKFLVVSAWFYMVFGFIAYLPTLRLEVPIICMLMANIAILTLCGNFVFQLEDKFLNIFDVDDGPEALRDD